MKTMISKLVAIALLFTIAVSNSFAQTNNLDEVPGCLVTDVTRKVTYTEPGNPTPKPVTAGMVLADDATVVVGKKAKFTLVCDDRSLTVNKKGTYQMGMLTKDVQAKGEVSRFAKMAFAAKGFVRGDTTKKKGWGDKDSILFNAPLKGKIPFEPTKFSWTTLKPGSNYNLKIYQNNASKAIISVMASVGHFTFDPTQLSFTPGVTYNAVIAEVNGQNVASQVVSFIFVNYEDVINAMEDLKVGKEYKNSNEMQKVLLEAEGLENLGYHSLANERYIGLLSKEPNNSLLNQMYAAFWKRISME